mmetsp:Transcript_34585/g.74758  ORF Transcript_34585/g.74758 Transcript_34585/m.74758 type:complete len:219 (-) Transcript_34585:299-955(-)
MGPCPTNPANSDRTTLHRSNLPISFPSVFCAIISPMVYTVALVTAFVCNGAMFNMSVYDLQLSNGIRSAISVGVQPRVMPTFTERICSSTRIVANRRMDVLMMVFLSRLARWSRERVSRMELVAGIVELSDDAVLATAEGLSTGVLASSMLVVEDSFSCNISGIIVASVDGNDDSESSRVAACSSDGEVGIRSGALGSGGGVDEKDSLLHGNMNSSTR